MAVMMGMGVRFTVLMILISLLTVSSAYAIACADLPGYQTLVCGSTPDSGSGLGAVDVCNICYPCGAADGVCPEDFYTSGDGQGSCRFCPDPDCLVTINGTVEDVYGNPVFNASITVLYEPDIKETLGQTNPDGTYQVQVRTGFIKIYVAFEDYDSRIIDVDIKRSTTPIAKTINFIGGDAIEPGSCSASCTDNFGNRCKASCAGINGCSYESFQIATLCDDKIIGSRVFLPGSDTDYVLCCQGTNIYSTNNERISTSPTFTGQLRDGTLADELVTFTQRTRSAGERVTIQVAVWGSQE